VGGVGGPAGGYEAVRGGTRERPRRGCERRLIHRARGYPQGGLCITS